MANRTLGILLLRFLASQGKRIFSVKEAQEAAPQIGLDPSYVADTLHYLLKKGWLVRLKRGLYAFSSDSGFGPAPHEFTIAMALVNPSAISHWTAMHYHHLTQQTPNKVFAITPSGTSLPRSLDTKHYQFIQIKKEHFFGIETVWIDDMQVQITDQEKTLLDGLAMPQHCGDFQEVLHAFKRAKDNIDLEKMIKYALKLSVSVTKRLGFILEKLGVNEKKLSALLERPMKGYCKLDPTGLNEGIFHSKWKIRENIGT